MSDLQQKALGGEMEPPLDWFVRLGDIIDRDGPLEGTREASAEECRKIADALSPDGEKTGVSSLVCDYSFRPVKLPGLKGQVAVRGEFRFRAALRQTCVVTLQRIDTQAEDAFRQDFVEGAETTGLTALPADEEDNPFADEPPLDIQGGRVRYGPLVYEYLVMAMDLNPRAPGAEFDEEPGERGKGERPPSPFAVLKNLKDRQ